MSHRPAKEKVLSPCVHALRLVRTIWVRDSAVLQDCEYRCFLARRVGLFGVRISGGDSRKDSRCLLCLHLKLCVTLGEWMLNDVRIAHYGPPGCCFTTWSQAQAMESRHII